MDEPGGASSPSAAAAPGALRSLAALAVNTLRTRVELATVELELYALRTVQIVLLGIAAIVCALLATAFALVTLIVALWDTHRLAGLLGGTGAFVALAVVCGAAVGRLFRSRPRMLEGTLEQLERDQHSLSGSA